jgi:hypothetical protein
LETLTDSSAKIRKANDEIAANARRLEIDPDFPIPFLCECSNPPCFGFVRLRLDAYERHKERGGALALPEHLQARTAR